MSNGFTGGFAGGNIGALLANYIGETVTIFTTSGGQSGSGFTGVILGVNECLVRLITRVGPPPGCSLGNACSGVGGYGDNNEYGANNPGYGGGFGGGSGAMNAGGWDGYPVYNVGSVTDIPISAIASFVHNAV